MPIPNTVSLTLSPPTRLTALVGVLVLTGLAAVVFMLGRGALAGDGAATTISTPVVHTPRTAKKPAGAKAPAAKPKPRVVSGFPARIDHALRYSRVVVVSVSIPGAAVDAVVRKEARTAARATHAAFVPVSALNERVVSGLMAKTGILPDPAVVVLKRPGVVVATFSVTDAGTIAQAVVGARR
jgi:hypothetical protein